MNTTRKLLVIALAFALVLCVGASFTTIDNQPDIVAPQMSLAMFDSDGIEITDFTTATVRGTVTFRATVTNTPYPAVEIVKMTVTGAGTGTHYFEQSPSNTNIWTLELDTTTYPDGEYTFTSSYTTAVIDPPSGGGGGGGSVEMPFSVLSFSFVDGDGSSVIGPDYSQVIMIGAGIVGVGALLFWYRRR